MEKLKELSFLQRLLLLFWALFFTLVLGSNLTDGLQAADWIQTDFAFASGNYALMQEVTAVYGTPHWMVVLFFVGVLIWEALAGWLFWRAFLRFPADRSIAQAALSVGILLTAAFILMDELFLVFRVTELEKAHLLLFIALVLTLLVVRIPGISYKA